MRHLSFSAFAHTRRGHTLLAAGAMLAISVMPARRCSRRCHCARAIVARRP